MPGGTPVALTLLRDGRRTRLPMVMPAPGGRVAARTVSATAPEPRVAAAVDTRTAVRGQSGSPAGPDPYARLWASAGVRLSPADPREVARADYDGGFKITAVRAGGPADAAGLRRGDVLVGLHEFSTVKVDDLAFVLNHDDLPEWNPLKFYIVRDGETHYGHLRLTTR